MKKHIWIRAVLFFALLLICIFGVSRWNMLCLRKSVNHEDFYKLKKNSVDVLFVGSSHSYCAFIPAKLYEDYHISSYNLASSNQSMLANYLWAKEAYETQKYKVLVVEAMSVPMSHGDVVNDIRSLNSMGNSRHYYELMKTYKREAIKVLFPVLAFHSEWENIGWSDLVKKTNESEVGLRGYVPLFSTVDSDQIEKIIDEEDESIGYLKYDYVDKLRDFCDENGIQLMIVKTPIANAYTNYWDAGLHNNLANYSETYHIPFIDFNLASLQNNIGINVSEVVAADGRHCNVTGAEIVTAYIGQYIQEYYGIYSDEYSVSSREIQLYHDAVKIPN